jgi:hypothetical protein
MGRIVYTYNITVVKTSDSNCRYLTLAYNSSPDRDMGSFRSTMTPEVVKALQFKWFPFYM